MGRGYDPPPCWATRACPPSSCATARCSCIQGAGRPYAFFDAGYAANNAAATGLGKSRTLTSVGAGVVFRVFNRANLEVTYAHPLDAVRAGGSRPSDRVLIQLTASLL